MIDIVFVSFVVYVVCVSACFLYICLCCLVMCLFFGGVFLFHGVSSLI